MFYSKSSKGFYSKEINGDAIPSDAVEITDILYEELLIAQSAGKIISFDEKGFPVALSPTISNPQISINNYSREYLRKTDWYVIRNIETGEPIPEEISEKRFEARTSIIEV